ncbi:hypothetical protein MKW98_012700 [Papaver atlanticum]|uniref:Transmembrane protein n=1 Tax=Papaver atlanticum TaxID=357466 RepID=A0AAD4XKV5_9MAGN|nr:hypothetical protein MKW98_012700 [Papaver atlanticum]
MEETNLEQRLHALTHLLTHPTVKPSLHSQLFISNQVPCYLNWDYPPFLCKKQDANNFPSLHLKWGFTLFLRRVLRLGPPLTSWRSQCPYQQPPPLILAKGLEVPTQLGEEQRREYFRKRVKRKRFGGWNINPLIPVLVPNLMLLSLLFLKPFADDDP